MKKTLAAVLAAAMALSTATVVLADDSKADPDLIDGSVSGSTISKTGVMGGDKTFLVSSVYIEEDGNLIDGSELAVAMGNGDITAAVIVTNNQSRLSGRPSITAGKTSANQTLEKTVKYEWQDPAGGGWDVSTLKNVWGDVEGLNLDDMAVGEEVKVVCLKADGTLANSAASVARIVKKGDRAYASVMETLMSNGEDPWFNKTYSAAAVKGELPQLKVSFKHTYGIDGVDASMKLRFTVKAKDGITLGNTSYAKGDTITSELIKVSASYYQLANYYEDMQLTKEEVAANRVLLNGKELYDALGENKRFSITFGDDIAMFEGKTAVNQRTVNLYYNTDEIEDVVNQYPDVDFTFLTFKGNPAPTFQNTGSMVFAAKDKNTTVYEFIDGVAVPMELDHKVEYNDTYKTITVSGIKKLGTYIIASEMLEVEEEPEEPAEPVDSTPVAEPDDDEGQNPNTGAC